MNYSLVVFPAALLMAGCAGSPAGAPPAQENAHRPSLFLALPSTCNTPDGMTLDASGNIILSCPNFNEPQYPGVLMRIDPQNRLSDYFATPPHPDTRRACPMGLEFGPDGHLYYADNQYFHDQNYKSRLVRVVHENGKPVRAEVVVEGFKLANAVRWQGDAVFVSDTFFDLPDRPGQSGVYRFSRDELRGGPLRLRPAPADPHLIATFTTVPNHRNDLAGSDGLAFDLKGRLFTGNFGDGVLSRLTFDAAGKLTANEIISRALTCTDGMVCDRKSGSLYITDSENNAIHVLSPDGVLTKLWENEDTDGADGLLDQPCEPLVRGGELIIANFDMPFPGLKNKAYDPHHTLSVIRLR